MGRVLQNSLRSSDLFIMTILSPGFDVRPSCWTLEGRVSDIPIRKPRKQNTLKIIFILKKKKKKTILNISSVLTFYAGFKLRSVLTFYAGCNLVTNCKILVFILETVGFRIAHAGERRGWGRRREHKRGRSGMKKIQSRKKSSVAICFFAKKWRVEASPMGS